MSKKTFFLLYELAWTRQQFFNLQPLFAGIDFQGFYV